MNKTSFLIPLLTYPIRCMPLRVIHFLGNRLGLLVYYLIPHFRKRTLSNLSLAKDLHLSEKQLIKTAKKSLQNLAITLLEYAKFDQLDDISDIVICENPEKAQSIINQNTGIVFFCAHQANWEVLFLDGTKRMRGIAIGRPIKNTTLYNWITSIREKFGGRVITPKSALKEGLRTLKSGGFIGVLGDQSMPESNYFFDFFGRRAYTTPIPAVLAYRTQCPIIVASVRRERGKYYIHYSDPIWPDSSKTMKSEIYRMMKISLGYLESSIRNNLSQWLWQHNRWKQESPINVYYRYRYDSILIILPPKQKDFEKLQPHLKTFRLIYPKAFITVLVHKRDITNLALCNVEIIPYNKENECLIKDYRFKLVFNFTHRTVYKSHFLKQSAFQVLNTQNLIEAAQEHLKEGDVDNLSTLLLKSLCRPNTLWKKNAS